MRNPHKAAPFAAAALAVVIYFGVAIFSGTSVTEAIETREGIREIAAAAEKVIRYDDLMNTRMRKGEWAKDILVWPAEKLGRLQIVVQAIAKRLHIFNVLAW